MVGAVSPCPGRGWVGGWAWWGAYLAALAAVAVGTLGPLLERAVVRVAARVGALLRGEKMMTPSRSVIPSLPHCCHQPLLHPSQRFSSHFANGETEAQREMRKTRAL